MQPHRIVSEHEWLAHRLELLEKEKELTRLRDELSRQRRALPWMRVGRNYLFESAAGRKTLGQLFEGRSQLIVYHFMFGPDMPQGCPSCSYLSDHFDGAITHLAQRDVTLVVVSRAPLDHITPFQQRMGWKFQWVSSHGTDFNYDFHVSFTPEQIASGAATYNFATTTVSTPDLHGASVFYKDEWGDIFHTYSTYARGLDAFVGAYSFMDITPKGRDEDGLEFGMSWVRHHDRYPPPAGEKLDRECCSNSRLQSA
jgi:predicted dithiol-disulfide oxidoreductase (DUF899 family)